MTDRSPSKANLLQEVEQLRQRVSELELLLANSQQTKAEQALREREHKLRIFADALPDQAVIWGADGICRDVVKRGDPATWPLPENVVGQSLKQVFDRDFAEFCRGIISKALYQNSVQVLEYSRGNLHREARIAPFHDLETGEEQALWIWRDITPRKEAEAELERNTQLRELLIKLTLDFITFPNNEIDSRINNLLKQIGEFIGADRSYINIYSNQLEKASRIYEWCAEGIEPRIHKIQNIWLKPFSWTLERFLAYQTIHIRSLHDLPDGSAEKQLWIGSGGKSGIHLPIWYHDKLIGELGFHTVKSEKRWSEDTVNLVKIAVQIYINALEHKESEQRLRESEHRYRSLLEQVPVALMVWEIGEKQLQMAYANPAAGAFYRIDDINSLVGTDAATFNASVNYTEETRRLAKERSDAFLAGKNLGAAEFAIRQSDGSTSYAMYDLVRINYENKSAILTIIRDITEQRNAEKALRESERRLRSILEALPDRVVVFDEEGTYQEVLKKHQLPHEPQVEIGDNIYDVNQGNKAVADLCVAKLRETLQKQENLVFEYEFDSGEKIYSFEGRTAPYKDPITNQALVIWMTRDISQQRAAEKSLRESEKRFNSLMQAVPVRIVVLDELGNYRDIVKSQQWYDEPVTVRPGDNLYKLFDKDFADFCVEKVRETLQKQERLSFEYDDTVFGKNFSLIGHTAPYRDPVTNEPLVIWVTGDNKEKRQAERALRESEKRLRSILEALPDRAVVLDEDGTYHEIVSAEKWENRIPIQIGDNIRNWADNTIAEFIIGKVRETLQLQKSLVFEYEREDAKQERFLEGRTVPYKDPVTNQPLVLWIVRDMTPQREAEKNLLESRKRFNSLMQSVPVRIVVLDEHGSYHEVVKTHDWYNSPVPVRPGDNIYNLFNKDFADFCMDKVRETLQKKETISFEYEHNYSGKNSFLAARTVPYQDPVTNEPLVIWITNDNSQQREAERNLRESEDRYRTLVEQMPALVYRASLQNPATTHYVSPYIKELLGYTQEEWLNIADNLASHIHPDDKERVIKEKHMTFPFVGEYRMLTRQNQTLWVRDEALVVRDRTGQNLIIQGVIFDITAQKNFEKALRESEKSYRAVFNSSTNLLSITDGDTILLVNQAAAEILAYDDPSDLVGRSLSDFIHPDDKQFVMRIAKMRREGASVPSRFEMRLIDKHGEIHCIDSHSQTIEFAGHQVTLASAVDITEQKRFEMILRESEANYRAVVQDQTELICRFTPDSILTFVNHAYEQYFGSDGKKLVGSNFWEIIPEIADRESLKAKLSLLSIRQTPENPVISVESDSFIVNGERRTIQWTVRALFDYKGNLLAYQSVGRDITEQKKAELAIREREGRLRLATRLARLGIWDWEVASDKTHWYGDMFNIYGISEEEFTGKGADYIQFTREDYRIAQEKNIKEAFENTYTEAEIASGKELLVSPKELCIVCPDGTEHYTLGDAIAIVDNEGKPLRMLGVTMDITALKQVEAELARYRDHLEELVKARTSELQHEILEHEQTQKSLRQSLDKLDAANRELEAFSYTVSHDLRAPLRALNNYSQFLQEDCASILSEECLQYTEGIAESAQQMERLVLELLDYSQINRVELPCTDVDIAELLDELIMRLGLDQHARLHLPPKLPDIYAKRIRLEQIFSNLLSNALKFRQRELPLEITIACEERADEWLFSVRDNGIGIEAKHQAKIFGIFQRLHTQEEYEGTGIGLAIVEKAVKEHDGQVAVESEPGKGSKFSFTISRHLSKD